MRLKKDINIPQFKTTLVTSTVGLYEMISGDIKGPIKKNPNTMQI